MSYSQIVISKQNLLFNLRQYKKTINDSPIMAVVKSNAYGHGLIKVAQAIDSEVDWMAVASGQEALALRQAKIRAPILVLSFYHSEEIPLLLRGKVSLVVYHLDQLQELSKQARKLKIKAKIHLKVDTGTSRLGVLPAEVREFIDKILRAGNLELEGVFSHFAASEVNSKFTLKQNQIFDGVLKDLQNRGINPIRHIACTAAGIVLPESQHDVVRLGIGLYGLWPSQKTKNLADFLTKPVLSWQTQIIQIKNLPAGTFVGYGLTFKTKRPTKLAVLPVGYFDGYDRRLSNTGVVSVKRQRCKILGRVCMNLIMVDVTAVPNVKVGDKVGLIDELITADELAQKTGTINYEIVTRINPNVPRIIK